MSSYRPSNPSYPGGSSTQPFQSNGMDDDADFGVDDTQVYDMSDFYSNPSTSLQPHILTGHGMTSTLPDLELADRSFETFGDGFTEIPGESQASEGTHAAYTRITVPRSYHNDSGDHTRGTIGDHRHPGYPVQGWNPMLQNYASPSRSTTWSSHDSMKPDQGSVFGDDEDDRRESRRRNEAEQRDAYDRHDIQAPVGSRYAINPPEMSDQEQTTEETPRKRKGKGKSSKKRERTNASQSRSSGR